MLRCVLTGVIVSFCVLVFATVLVHVLLVRVSGYTVHRVIQGKFNLVLFASVSNHSF